MTVISNFYFIYRGNSIFIFSHLRTNDRIKFTSFAGYSVREKFSRIIISFIFFLSVCISKMGNTSYQSMTILSCICYINKLVCLPIQNKLVAVTTI